MTVSSIKNNASISTSRFFHLNSNGALQPESGAENVSKAREFTASVVMKGLRGFLFLYHDCVVVCATLTLVYTRSYWESILWAQVRKCERTRNRWHVKDRVVRLLNVLTISCKSYLKPKIILCAYILRPHSWAWCNFVVCSPLMFYTVFASSNSILKLDHASTDFSLLLWQRVAILSCRFSHSLFVIACKNSAIGWQVYRQGAISRIQNALPLLWVASCLQYKSSIFFLAAS